MNAKLTLASACLIAACALTPGAGFAAAKPQPAKAAKAPALKALEGLWMMSEYKSSRNFTARQRVGFTADGQMPPLRPAAAAILEQRLKAADDDGLIFGNNAARCVAQGLPYMIFAAVDGPIQIIEQPDQVTILSTELSENWYIFLNTPHAKEVDANYHGESVGHWEGKTLVIDTIGLAGDKTTIDQVGMPHSDDLHLITRMRRTDDNTLEIVVTIDDPKTFTAPWNRRIVYKRAAPGARMEEWVCENVRNPTNSDGLQTFEGRVILKK